ncbi:MAG TPA: hypothetical protein VFT74_05020, partial [Isosphaeraceae bacterium]|nr:hypothetical protein [Isosphaeraceae bacterium]
MPTTGALRLTRNLVFTVLAIGALPVQAQDYLQDYNEERIKPERIPEEVRKTAESVTPKANYNQTFDGDYFYRFVGPTDDGRFVETMVSDDGRLGSIRLRTPVKPTALPRAVSAAFEAQRAKDELLKGFQPTRVEKVETRKEVNSQPDVAYEYEGRNAEKVWVRCVIEESGQVRKLDFLLVHPDMKRHRQERNLANLPAAVKQAAVAAAPGYRFTQAFEDNPEDGFPSLMLKGVNARGQAVELDLDPKNGRLNSAAFDISSRQVPASVVSVYRGHARTDEELKGFQIVRTVRLDLPALGDVAYVLYGRDAEGEAQEVRIGPGPDIFSVLPTSAENLESAAADAEKLPAPGSDVLNIEYAYWGYGLRWDDVTELVRSKVDDGRLTLTANVETLTSPPVDSARTLVVAFSVGKRFDLATAVENQEMQLPPPNFEGQTVVAHGLQILKATTGVDTRWADATAKARTQVQGDRLELEPLKFEWPDPAYGVYKTKTVLYAHEGKVGLYVGGDSVPISIPPKPSEPPTLALPVSRPLKTFEGDK